MRTLFIGIIGLVVAGAGLLSPALALAASPEGLELNPAIFEDKVDPGQSYPFTLKVRNVSETDKVFYLNTRDIKAVDEGGRPIFATEGEPTPFSVSTWVSFTDEEVSIAAGETKSVGFTINVPPEAGPGAHFGGIFLETEPPRLRSTGSGVGVSVGSIINLQISGDVVEDARLRSFSTSKIIYDTPPIEFENRIENLGNTLIRPTGFVEIINMFGKQVANIRVNESNAGVFPNDERTFKVSWAPDDEFVFGRYQTILSLVYGDEVRKTVSATASFWVLPMKPIATILGSALAIILILYFGVRGYIRGKLRQMGVTTATSKRSREHEARVARTLFLVVVLIVFVAVFLGGLFLLFA